MLENLKQYTKGRNGKIISVILGLVILSGFLFSVNIKDRLLVSKSIKAIREGNYSVAIRLFERNNKNDKYMVNLVSQIESYSIELFNTYISDSDNYEYYNERYNTILEICNSDTVNNYYTELNNQYNYLNKIKQAIDLENNNKIIEAYKEIEDIDINECLIYDEFDKYKNKLKNSSIAYIDEYIKNLSIIDAYVYLESVPLDLVNKVEEYKQLLINDVDEKIKNMSKEEALQYLDTINSKVNIQEIEDKKNHIQETYENKEDSNSEKENSNKVILNEKLVVEKMIKKFPSRYYEGESYAQYIDSFSNDDSQNIIFEDSEKLIGKSIYIVCQGNQLGHIIDANTGEIYLLDFIDWDESGKKYKVSSLNINIFDIN